MTKIIFVLVLALLLLFIRGSVGGESRLGGPFESSGSTSRYALVQSIVDDKSFTLSIEKARFGSPDVDILNGKYISLFTPGVSLLGVPFYLIGKYLGIPQLSTYFLNLVLACLNFYLIIRLSSRLKVTAPYSIIGALVFLFATSALSYATTFTQHHAVTSVVLLGLINLLGERSLTKNIGLALIFGLGALVDIPVIFIFVPILFWGLIKNIAVTFAKSKVNIKLNLSILGFAAGILPIVVVYAFYNIHTTGNPLLPIQIHGGERAVFSAEGVDISRAPSSEPGGGVELPFSSRRLLNGLYILLVSTERGLLFYSPVLAFGLLGFYFIYMKSDEKEKNSVAIVLTVVAFNILLYAMFHDPWGGWAFGPRYLIPTAALLSVGVSAFLSQRKGKSLFYIFLFNAALLYSIGVNIVGALTTTLVPPKIEAVNLATPIPYSYEYNLQLVLRGFSGSLAFNNFFRNHISASAYALLLTIVVYATVLILYFSNWLGPKWNKNGKS